MPCCSGASSLRRPSQPTTFLQPPVTPSRLRASSVPASGHAMPDLRLTIQGGHEAEARLREVLAREGFRIVEGPRPAEDGHLVVEPDGTHAHPHSARETARRI